MVYPPSQKGFTLIELVMTLLLLGILSATALPKFFAASSYKKQLFFDDTLSAVRYAQKLAVATSCNVQVSIDNNSYTLKRPADHSLCISPTDFSLSVRRPGTGEADYTHDETGVSLSATPSIFYFTALGKASADVILTVADNKMINVVAATGFIYETP